MFKKLVDMLFEEEEVIEDFESSYDEIEEVSLPKYDLPPISTKRSESSISNIKASDNDSFNEQIKSQPIFNNVVMDKVETKSTMIDIEVDSFKEKNVSKKASTPTKNDYEFTKVISPIYGLSDSEKISLSRASKHKVSARKQPNSSILGTVFSPIYGVEKEKFVEKIEKTEQFVNVSLDDLIASDDKTTNVKDGWYDFKSVEEDYLNTDNDFDSLIKTYEDELVESKKDLSLNGLDIENF